MIADNWAKMTPDEKFEARLDRWLSTEDKKFATPEAAERYQQRVQRFIDIIKLKQPDRIPSVLRVAGFVAEYAGVTHGEMFYDYDKAIEALIKFHEDFEVEYVGSGSFLPGKMFDLLDYALYRWPGGNLDENIPFQALEGEYMPPDGYDALIADPEGYCMRVYMPRAFRALESWKNLPSFYSTMELPMIPFMLAPIGRPEVLEAFQKFLEAAQIVREWLDARARVGAVTLAQMGLPGTMGGFTKVPFDIIGDTMRGTRGIMLDMYRQPEKLLEALERLVPVAVKMGVQNADASRHPMIMLPLHKGADGFMSNDDFAKFYWPTFKATILGLIEEGVVPQLFVEGSYNQRLDIIAESGLPAGKTVWMFDQSDMGAVKQKIGSWACIGGNVPASLFKAGSPQQMDDYIKDLVEAAGAEGGFFICPGAAVDDGTIENIQAFIDSCQKYGAY